MIMMIERLDHFLKQDNLDRLRKVLGMQVALKKDLNGFPK
jgi:hypothetical protein